MIKAVFLDFDFTLYSHNEHKIPDSAYEAIMKAKENGVKIFMSTGRPLYQLYNYDTRDIPFDGYVLNNGELILNEKREVLSVRYIEGKAKEKLIELYNAKQMGIAFTNLKGEYLNLHNKTVIDAYEAVGSELGEVKEYDGGDILMAVIFVDNDEDMKKVKELEEYLEMAWWRYNSCDAINKGSSKHSGNLNLLKRFNIDIKDTMAVGDSNNDIEMLEGSGIAVAMGNGTKEVKEVSDYITDDIDKDGLYNAFKHYQLI